jgi:hypothetical protein
MSRKANTVRTLRFSTPARLYVYDTLLQRLASHLQDMTAELGQFIEKEHAVVRERHLARHRHVAPAYQPRVRSSVLGG